MNENNRIRPDVPLNDADPNSIHNTRVEPTDFERNIEARTTSGPILAGFAVLALLALGIYFWPRNVANTNVTEGSPRVERPNTPSAPPANAPTPTPQAQPPQ